MSAVIRINSPLFNLSRTYFHSHPRPRIRARLKLAYPAQPRSRPFSSSPPVQATHHDTPASSLLSQTLDQRQRMSKANQADNVGPFTLGMVQQPMGVNDQPLKKWKDLDTKGKVMRTTARTTNFTVIILGAGLTAMLVYALSSELFARNSPTVLYGEACSRIKASEKIAEYLSGPLVFHNNPPSSSRPRHRNRNVSSQLAVDSQGREHLLLNFYIRGSSSGSSHLSDADDEGYIARTWVKAQEKIHGLADTTWDEAVAWGSDALRRAKDRARQLFLYLTGESASSSSSSYPYPASAGSLTGQRPVKRETQIGRGKPEDEGGFWSSIVGVFSGIGVSRKGPGASGRGRGELEEVRERYEEGEVHCDLVKDNNGNFVWRYIIVDMPNSRVPYPNRVFVERSADVRNNEAVIRWY